MLHYVLIAPCSTAHRLWWPTCWEMCLTLTCWLVYWLTWMRIFDIRSQKIKSILKSGSREWGVWFTSRLAFWCARVKCCVHYFCVEDYLTMVLVLTAMSCTSSGVRSFKSMVAALKLKNEDSGCATSRFYELSYRRCFISHIWVWFFQVRFKAIFTSFVSQYLKNENIALVFSALKIFLLIL